MSIKTHFRVITILVLLLFPAFAMAAYKVVVKENGKIIEGELVSEDDTTLTIINAGARLKYQKSELDLVKMKTLNTGYKMKGEATTFVLPDKTGVKPRKKNDTSLTDVAKKNSAAQSQTTSRDLNEQALDLWVIELDQKGKITPTMQTQMQLSKAKKALAYYRARNEREFSETDRRLMLQQLVQALEFVYTKELEAGISDDKAAAMKKRIEQTKQELAGLD
jgi:hypothetical protein